MLVGCWQRSTGRPVCKMMALEFVLVVSEIHTHARIREGWWGDNLVNMYLPVENLGFKLVLAPHRKAGRCNLHYKDNIFFFATHTYKDILGLICII